jgi:hypothetical protein
MVKEELGKRIKRCGVCGDSLKQGVQCGAYPNIESALDRLDSERPLGKLPRHVVTLSRMMLVNDDIDQALFSVACATSAWTWLEDFRVVFVVMGPESRGLILHERMKKRVPYRLELHQQSGTRFMRFRGDKQEERVTKKGKPIFSLFQLLAGKMHASTTEVRDIFEALLRTCDEPGWNHAVFPFVWPGRALDAPMRLMRRHNLLVHDPHARHIIVQQT